VILVQPRAATLQLVIARRWTARAAGRQEAEAYVVHFESTVRPQLESTDGFVGASVECRDGDGVVEIVVVTLWASMEAIRTFAGPESDRAVVEPDARAVLVAFDSRVTHTELPDEPGSDS
jgi:heme-degrading monooxygenase HmoA